MTVLLGGARSGKSDLATRMASNLAAETGVSVCLVATAESGDDDMADRIARHKADRPPHWTTRESPHFGAAEVGACGPGLIVIDCMTMLTTNLHLAGQNETAILSHVEALMLALSARTDPSILISNEVGMGVVPATELGRTWRDLHGRANRIMVEHATTAYLVIAGATLPLTSVPNGETSRHG